MFNSRDVAIAGTTAWFSCDQKQGRGSQWLRSSPDGWWLLHHLIGVAKPSKYGDTNFLKADIEHYITDIHDGWLWLMINSGINGTPRKMNGESRSQLGCHGRSSKPWECSFQMLGIDSQVVQPKWPSGTHLGFLKWGYPNKCMVYFMENPSINGYKWMMTGGAPMTKRHLHFLPYKTLEAFWDQEQTMVFLWTATVNVIETEILGGASHLVNGLYPPIIYGISPLDGSTGIKYGL